MLYLLCINPPYRHAKHYLGFTERKTLLSIEDRIAEHIGGQGSPLVKSAYDAGHKITLVGVFEGDRTLERRIKNNHNTPRLCPCCDSGKRRPPRYAKLIDDTRLEFCK